MNTTRLLIESAAYNQIKAIVENLNSVPVAREAETYRKAILELKDIIKVVEEEEKR